MNTRFGINTFMNGELMETFCFDSLSEARSMLGTLVSIHEENKGWIKNDWTIECVGFSK